MLTQARKAPLDRAVLATVAGIAFACPMSAQTHRRIEIAAALGAFLPFGRVPSAPGATSCPDHCNWAFGETRTVVAGGRVTVWLGKRAAIEGSIFYGPSGVTGSDQSNTSLNPEFAAQGNVALTSLRAVLKVAAPIPTMSVLLMAGPATIHQFGGGWPDGNSPTSLGGVFGIGLDIHREHGLAFRAAIEDYVGSSWETPLGPYGGSLMHHDVVFSLSAGPSLFGHRGERH